MNIFVVAAVDDVKVQIAPVPNSVGQLDPISQTDHNRARKKPGLIMDSNSAWLVQIIGLD